MPLNCSDDMMLKVRLCLFACALLMPTSALLAAGTDGEGRALIRDTLILVRAAEQRVWMIGHYEIEDLMPQSLLNVCPASIETRRAGLRGLKAQVDALGGPIERAWENNGKSLNGLELLLTRNRAYTLLSTTMERAPKQCPFYLKIRRPYVERHRAVGRSYMGVEGGGLFNLRLGTETGRAGGGGAGRLIYGYGLSPRWSIRMGIESGGAGFLNRQLEAEDIDVDMYFGAPIVLRHRSEFWHQDIEVAGAALGVPWRDQMRYAGRVAGLIGVTYPRLGQVQPWFGIRFGAEYSPEQHGAPDFVTVRLGFRVGLDLHFDKSD
ncbi:MAG: hypothetical protein VX589_04515 [Myxococcota bacterium]|nr:hypothetical protein [Myxococcota bacterium]